MPVSVKNEKEATPSYATLRRAVKGKEFFK